jgi:hypothetical protein
MESFRLFELLRALLEQTPSLLILLVCIVLAFIRWKRHPKVSLTLVIGLGLLLLHGIAFAIVYHVVPYWFIRSATSENIQVVIQRVYLVLALISNSLAAVCFVVLLVAVFMQRNPALDESKAGS